MKPIRRQLAVNFDYEVVFTEGLFDPDNRTFLQLFPPSATGQAAKFLILIDDSVDRHHTGLRASIEAYFDRHRELITLCGGPAIFPGGEKSKNDTKWTEKVLELINRHSIDRHSYVVAIGGGALLDTVGFASSIAHRGIRHIRGPTTVLSQNDSGLGVKNGINYFGKKNFVGSFSPPFAVVNDFDFLKTLNDRDWKSGISEAIKVGLIKDADLFSYIEETADDLVARDMDVMKRLIYDCAKLHLDHIVSGDPFELGSSRPLDFGHWSAHKLEQMTDYTLRHGEAVATGIALDTTYSYLTGLLDEASWHRILTLLRRLDLEIYVPQMTDVQNGKPILLDGLEEFREHLGGQLTIMLIQEIGIGVDVNTINRELMEKSINVLSENHPERALKDPDANS